MLYDVLAVFPIEIFAFAAGDPHTRWICATFLRSNRLIKTYKVLNSLAGTRLLFDIC